MPISLISDPKMFQFLSIVDWVYNVKPEQLQRLNICSLE